MEVIKKWYKKFKEEIYIFVFMFMYFKLLNKLVYVWYMFFFFFCELINCIRKIICIVYELNLISKRYNSY